MGVLIISDKEVKSLVVIEEAIDAVAAKNVSAI